MARWVCASQQAILSRVRELSKTIAIRIQRFHCFGMFSVPEASGISVGFPEALVWIALFSFSCVFNVSNVTNQIVPMARWACASQQAVYSRVWEPSKTIVIRVQRFHCFYMFSVPEASGHFFWFSGSSCLDDAVCIFIRFQCFDEACCLEGFMSGGVFGYKQ